MTDETPKWLTAADCAARTGLTVKALRVYERQGLLKPSRSANGWRRYGPEDLMRLNTISVLKALGLSLAQVGQLLSESPPSMLSVLQVQALSWRERHGEAAKALELVEAAIARLKRNQSPTLAELCQLISALQERGPAVQRSPTMLVELMKERLNEDEQGQWQAWWGRHPEDLAQNNAYLRERSVYHAVMQEQLDRGLSAADPAVQQQFALQDAAMARHGVRERTLRLMDWNLALTTKFMELGTLARERHPDQRELPFPLVSRAFATFYEQALQASAPVKALAPLFKSVEALTQAGTDPASSDADAVVEQLTTVCSVLALGHPEIYLRASAFIALVNHKPLPPTLQRTFEFLVQALRLRGRGAPQPKPEEPPPSAPALQMTAADLLAVRRGFARQLAIMAGVLDPKVEAAYAAVERERFVGAGPWSILSLLRGIYMTTPDDSPAQVYIDTAIRVDQAKRLNNGQPSLYYRLFAQSGLTTGAHVIHIGAGTGYYSAILAELVGREGRVTAIEYEADLAARSRANLTDWPQARVIHGDATQMTLEPADLVLVSCGATRVPDAWLDALKEDGQLILPLTPDVGMGAIFGIRRRAGCYFASMLSPVMIYACAGARDPASAAALAAALKNGGGQGVTRLYRGAPPPPQNCWLTGENWCLAYS